MAYFFYLGNTLCPVPPSKLQMKIKGQNKTLTLINEGEVNILKEAGLTEISFDLLLPNVNYPFATYKSGFKRANFFLGKIEKLKTNKKPFQFIVTRTLPNGTMLFDTNMKVSLEDYSIKEDNKEGFDVVVSIKLKQYKDFGTKTCKVVKNKVSSKKKRSSENSPSSKKNKTYTVVKGDNLWKIAKKHYGSATSKSVNNIYNANKAEIERVAKKHGKKSSNNGWWIYPGTVLTIPKA